MKGSVNKGFFTYFILFVVMALGAVLIAGFIMMFSPGAEILGYTYTNDKSHVKLKTYEGDDTYSVDGSSIVVLDAEGTAKGIVKDSPSINFTTLEKLVIKTNGMKVNLIYAGEEDRIDVQRSASGFGKVKEMESLKITKQRLGNTFIVTAFDSNPKLILSNNSKINVYFKQKDINLNLEIESKTSGLNFATSSFNQTTRRDLALKDLSFTTETGGLSISKDAVLKNSLIVKATKKSQIVIETDLGTTEAKLSKVAFDVAEGRITTKNLKASNLELKGDNVFVDFQNVYMNSDYVPGVLNFALKNGDFKVNTFEGNIIDQDEIVNNVSFSIKKMAGTFTLGKNDIANANKADILIDEVTSHVHIKTSTGNVKIKSSKGQALIQTYSGSVYYKVAATSTSKFDIKTNSGDIKLLLDNVTKANTAISEKGEIKLFYKDTLDNFTITATTKGAINFPFDSFIENNKQVVGYPSPYGEPPLVPYKTTYELTTSGNITVTPNPSTEWSLIE
jgi:hypothetical protein